MDRCASLVKPYTFVFNAHIILKQSGSTQVSCQVKPTVKCLLFQDKNFDLLCTKMWGQCFSVMANVSSAPCVVCWQAIRWRLSPGNDFVVTWMMALLLHGKTWFKNVAFVCVNDSSMPKDRCGLLQYMWQYLHCQCLCFCLGESWYSQVRVGGWVSLRFRAAMAQQVSCVCDESGVVTAYVLSALCVKVAK